MKTDQEMSYLSSITQSISEIKPLEILLCEIMESCKTLMDAGKFAAQI
ncbi:MAG: hypothetical protein IPM96_07955 [Ignavibacteria bacterium]|nr:hypothetical protein [Ignavibacteria bacterium]